MIQGGTAGRETLRPVVAGGSQESESEPVRPDESSEEGCHEQVGLTSSLRNRRIDVGFAERTARLPAIKSRLVVVRLFGILPPAAEHSRRNGLGAPLRC